MIDTNINETNILQKCSKCQKLMLINQFVNKQNRILKTYNLCCSKCEKDFNKDPEKYSKMLDEQAAKEKVN